MHVLIDGIIYSMQRAGGISRYFNELIPRLAQLPDMAVQFIPPGHCAQPTMRASRVHIRRHLFPSLVKWPGALSEGWIAPWRNMLERRFWRYRLRNIRNIVAHPTYYTTPLDERIPCVVTVHDMIVEKFRDLFLDADADAERSAKMASIRLAGQIVADSQQTKTDLCEISNIPEERVHVVYLGVDHDVFYPDGAASSGHLSCEYSIAEPYLFYVGGRWPHKNFMRLVEAYTDSSLREDLVLVVAGSRWTNTERMLLKKHGIKARVRLVSSPSTAAIRLLYQNATVFVCPSLYEGFGLPILEAMACGAPVAASRVSSIPEVAGDAAVYFDPYDTGDMARAIESLLNRSVAEDYRQRGLRRAQEFSWDRTAVQTAEVYRKALETAC